MPEKFNPEVITRAALRLLEKEGIDGLTMRVLATELQLRAATSTTAWLPRSSWLGDGLHHERRGHST